MTTSIPSFFSRDAILQRQARTLRSRKIAEAASTRNKTLNVILEEDESRLSSRSPSPNPSYAASTRAGGSPTLGAKARRRRANVADIKISRDLTAHDDNDLSPLFDDLLSAPRAAPRPPTTSSPSESPDSFRLTFTDVSFKFPHPPTPSPSSPRYHYDRSECASPTSISSLSSSPRSEAGGMPLTPSTSDDESIPSRTFDPRRAAIQPLVITKHNQRPLSPFDEITSVSPSLLQPFETPSEQRSLPIRSPLISAFMRDEYSEDSSDQESDSEWYSREFSKVLSLKSPIPPSFSIQHARPESMFIPEDSELLRLPTRRRVSKALPPTPVTVSKRASMQGPSGQLDPAFPSKRSSKTRSIPKYPPPPVPPIPLQYRSSVCSLVDFQLESPAPAAPSPLPSDVPRPPPRSSVPADCDYEFDVADDADDDSSAFSFSMYEIDLDHCLEEDGRDSPASAYSQPSFDDFSGQEVTFDLDYTLQLPLSLPTTPLDLEADFNMGLERLRTVEEEPVAQPLEQVQEQQEEPEQEVQHPVQPQELPDDVFSAKSTSSSFSFSPSPSPSPYDASYPSPSPSPNHNPYNEERVLKSKWSSSTLASVREEHEHRSPSSKLRLYFGGSQASPSKGGKRTSQSAKKGVPPTPTSPFSSLMSPTRRKSNGKGYPSSPTPASASPSTRARHSRGNSNSDVILIGYGHQPGVRRRGSVSTISDAGSELSSSSTSSSGLRRKPIPVEMFLRAT
ncbi:hypothetical protein CVT26_007248 [Gymnopilus dilepis]|uniref:Uncharacterized protein n=1 Tax=Gymnopilus dilepis TaxID=231916 RepID=A0A409VM70_9AGAR|nr:hypothetical protein CVT26_007248 [Gymnopilus dilepis]